MGLHSNGTVEYLQIRIWMMLFGTEGAPFCVDFRTFEGGEEDFMAKSRGFTGALSESNGG